MPANRSSQTKSGADPVKRWSALFVEETHIRMWDDDDFAVVYNAANGDTHLLEPLATELLQLLVVSPRNTDELADELADVFVDDQEDMALIMIEDSLTRLQDIGLVACHLN